jgi:hypothetical protein
VPRWFRQREIPRIRSAEEQPDLPKWETIDQIKADMAAERFEYARPDARISGYFDEETYFVSEGHHRVNAALELYWETRNSSYLNRLLEHGRWTPSAPHRNRRLPTRRLISKLLRFFRL